MERQFMREQVRESRRYLTRSSGIIPYRPEDNGCYPRLSISLSAFGAAFFFLLGINLDYMPVVPWPLIGNLLPLEELLESETIVVMFIVMWGIHFSRRFGEVLLLHDYRRKMSYLEAIGCNLYYWIFGLWNGWSLNFMRDKWWYAPPPILLVLIGTLLFVVGQIGNCASHIKLYQIRKKASFYDQNIVKSQHIIPRGPLFKYISCPHYLFESITWVGFAVATMTLAAFVFMLCTIITVSVYAFRRHKAYQKEFDGRNGRQRYPERKACIPFIF